MTDHPSLKLAADKRARLFLVSSAEFAEHGFNQASLNRIIGAVGMSKSSFYHYFRDKTDLFAQILNDALAPVIAARQDFDPQHLDGETFWPWIIDVTKSLTGIVNNRPEFVQVGRMFYRSLDNPQERRLTRDIMAELSHWIETLLARGQALGQIRDDLPASYLIVMVMALGVSTDRWMLAHWDEASDQDRLQMNGKILDMFRRLLVQP